MIARTRYIGLGLNVLTYLLTYISSRPTMGYANFGPDWPLLFNLKCTKFDEICNLAKAASNHLIAMARVGTPV